MPAPLTPAATCPGWCDPRCCSASTHADIRHSSEPTVLRTTADDVEVTVALHRDDERTADGYRPAGHGVSLDVRNLVSEWPGGGQMRADVLLTPADAQTLGRRLLALAELGGAP